MRYQITKVIRNEEKINEKTRTFGWKAYVTNVSKKRLGFVDIVSSYRQQYRVERIFNRLKSRVNISPMYVKKKDQIKGLTHLLMLGVRVYTLIEFVVRRSLSKSKEKLEGLHPENAKKMTDTPTCERILKAFSNITLTIFKIGSDVQMHISPLSQTQLNILDHLGLDPSVYNGLTENLEI